MMLSDVCLSRTSGLSREQRPWKTKIGTEVTHVTPLSRSGRFTHRGVNPSGSCSGERGNVLSVGTYCYIVVQARSARRREALRRPQREERGGAYCGGRSPTTCYKGNENTEFKIQIKKTASNRLYATVILLQICYLQNTCLHQ